MKDDEIPDLFFIDPAQVVVNENLSSRWEAHDEAAVASLVKSFEEDGGQLQPLQVRRRPDKRVQLVLGYRRYKASVEFNKRHPNDPMKLKAIVVDINDEEALRRNTVENRERKETTPMDDAITQNRLRESYGWTDTKIAEFYLVTPPYVGTIRKLLSLPLDVQRLVHTKQLSVQAAVSLAELPNDEQAKVLSVLATPKTAFTQKDGEALVRTFDKVVKVLMALGHDARPCLPQLLELLRDVHSQDGELALLQAVQAIATDEDTEAIDAIIDIMAEHMNEDFQERCSDALARIGGLNTLKRLLDYIRITYDNNNSRFAYNNDMDFLPFSFTRAVKAVAHSLGKEAVPLLIEALSENAGFASQIAAARALAGLGSEAEAALPDLARVLNSPNLQTMRWLPYEGYHPAQFAVAAQGGNAIALIAPPEESSPALGNALCDALYAALLTQETITLYASSADLNTHQRRDEEFREELLYNLSILVGRLAHSVGICETQAQWCVPPLLLSLSLPDPYSLICLESLVDSVKSALQRVASASSQFFPQLERILAGGEAEEDQLAARSACQWSLPFLKKALAGPREMPEFAVMVLDRLGNGCPGALQELQADKSAIRSIASIGPTLLDGCRMGKVRVLVRTGGELAEAEFKQMLEYEENSLELTSSVRALAGLGKEAGKFSPCLHKLLGHEAQLDKEIQAALEKINPNG